MTVPVLTGAGVVLRPPAAADAAARQDLGSDPEIHRMFGGSHGEVSPWTADRAADWLRTLIAHPHAWIIEAEGRCIGEIRLDHLDPADRRASLAIGIYDRNALGRGYGSEASRLVLTHAFTTLGLHRISLRVLAYNGRAIRSYEKCGFVVEGRERQSALVDGEWYDDIIMGVLASEFTALPS